MSATSSRPNTVGHTFTSGDTIHTEENLGDRFRCLHDECRAAILRAQNELTAATQSVYAAIDRARDAHERLRDRLSFDDVADEVERWRTVVRYRQDARREVVIPVQQALEQTTREDGITTPIVTLLERLDALAGNFLPEARLPDDDALYRSRGDDALITRGRKWLERRRRRLGTMAGRLASAVGRPSKVVHRERIVPAAILATYHVRARLPSLVKASYESLQQATAQRLAKLEDALMSWSLSMFDAEHALESPAGHRPELARELVPANQDEVSGHEPGDPSTEQDAAERARRTATELQAALATLQPPAVRPLIEERELDAALLALETDLERAGTFLLNVQKRRVDSADTRVSTVQAKSKRWLTWHEQILNRLRLLDELQTLREDLATLHDALLARISTAALGPVQSSFQHLRVKLDAAERATNDSYVAHAERAENLIEMLSRTRDDLLDTVKEVTRDPPGIESSGEVLAEAGDVEAAAIDERVEQLPADTIIHLYQPEDKTEVDPEKRAFTVDLQSIAKDALSPPLPMQLKRVGAALHQAILEVWESTDEITDIIQYNFDASVDELRTAGGATTSEALATARQLTTDALRRSSNTLDALEDSLADPWHAFELETFETFAGDWQAITRRARADAVIEEQWVGFRTRLARSLETSWQRTRERWSVGRSKVATLGRVGIRRAKHLLARGKTVVGVAEAPEDEALRTAEALNQIERITAALPLVYRKLFSFEPIREPALFEARDRDLVRVRQHFERWKEGAGPGVLILSAPIGSGRTSFLNLLRITVFKDATIDSIALTERFANPGELATALAEPLGGGHDSLASLEQALVAVKTPAAPPCTSSTTSSIWYCKPAVEPAY